jgi:hypothetical protein
MHFGLLVQQTMQTMAAAHRRLDIDLALLPLRRRRPPARDGRGSTVTATTMSDAGESNLAVSLSAAIAARRPAREQ